MASAALYGDRGRSSGAYRDAWVRSSSGERVSSSRACSASIQPASCGGCNRGTRHSGLTQGSSKPNTAAPAVALVGVTSAPRGAAGIGRRSGACCAGDLFPDPLSAFMLGDILRRMVRRLHTSIC